MKKNTHFEKNQVCVWIWLNVCVWWASACSVRSCCCCCLLPGLCVSALLYTSSCVYNIIFFSFFEEVPIAYTQCTLCSEGYTASEREKRESTPTITTISARPTSEQKKKRNAEAEKKNMNTKNKKNKNEKEEAVQRRCKNKCVYYKRICTTLYVFYV